MGIGRQRSTMLARVLRRTIEPWAASQRLLEVIETFAKRVGVMMAPVIPELDDAQRMEAAPTAGQWAC